MRLTADDVSRAAKTSAELVGEGIVLPGVALAAAIVLRISSAICARPVLRNAPARRPAITVWPPWKGNPKQR